MAKTCAECGEKISLWSDYGFKTKDGEPLCKECYHEAMQEFKQKHAERKQEVKEELAITLTTSYFIEGKRIVEHKGIISAEAVMGVNIFKDMFSEIRDVVGGRSGSYQKELRKAKELALNDLRDKAYELGANAVIGVDLDYDQLSAKGKSSLMVVANGTAVVVEDEQEGITRTNELLTKLLDRISEHKE